jgi:hypothetical protein
MRAGPRNSDVWPGVRIREPFEFIELGANLTDIPRCVQLAPYCLPANAAPANHKSDIAGMVAAITDVRPGGNRVKNLPSPSLVNRDPPSLRAMARRDLPPLGAMAGRGSATRRARRLDVQFDVGELSFVSRSVRSREAEPALNPWHPACYGWRVRFYWMTLGW